MGSFCFSRLREPNAFRGKYLESTPLAKVRSLMSELRKVHRPAERPTSNVEHSTLKDETGAAARQKSADQAERPTSNIQHPTSNGQTDEPNREQEVTKATENDEARQLAGAGSAIAEGGREQKETKEHDGTVRSFFSAQTVTHESRLQSPTLPVIPVTRGEAPGLVRSAGRPADVVAFEEAVVSYFVEAADVLGVPKSVAAIYGICFASPEPLSFSEIDERLDISAGSISQGLKFLKEVGALKTAQPRPEHPTSNIERPTSNGRNDQTSAVGRQLAGASQSPCSLPTKPSTRASEARATFTPDLELRNLVLHWIETRLEGQLKSGQDRMEAILAAVPAGAAGDALRDRIEHLQNWQKKARALLPIMRTFLTFS